MQNTKSCRSFKSHRIKLVEVRSLSLALSVCVCGMPTEFAVLFVRSGWQMRSSLTWRYVFPLLPSVLQPIPHQKGRRGAERNRDRERDREIRHGKKRPKTRQSDTERAKQMAEQRKATKWHYLVTPAIVPGLHRVSPSSICTAILSLSATSPNPIVSIRRHRRRVWWSLQCSTSVVTVPLELDRKKRKIKQQQ